MPEVPIFRTRALISRLARRTRVAARASSAHLQYAASDLIENNIDIIGIGKDAMAVIDDSLDLSQPVHRSVVWFLVLAHRGRRLVPL